MRRTLAVITACALLLAGCTHGASSASGAVGASTSGLTSTGQHGWYEVPGPQPAAAAAFLHGVAGSGPDDAWAVGWQDVSTGSPSPAGPTQDRGLIEHWDGTAWLVTPNPIEGANGTRLSAVTAISGGDAWAVGYFWSGFGPRSLIEHSDGTAWTVTPSPVPDRRTGGETQARLNGIDAASASDVWAVGGRGGIAWRTLVQHWGGTAWSVVPSPSIGQGTNELTAVCALSRDDAWAVGYYWKGGGDRTLIEHWNGTSWKVMPSPNVGVNDRLEAIDAASTSDIWAVGRSRISGAGTRALIEHWNGNTWSVVPSPSPGSYPQGLSGATVVSPNDVLAVGSSQPEGARQASFSPLIEHWNGTAWSVVAAPDLGSGAALLGSAPAFPGTWAVGYRRTDVAATRFATVVVRGS